MADAADSKSVARKGVQVRSLSPVLENKWFLIIDSSRRPEDNVSYPFRTHNSPHGQRIRRTANGVEEGHSCHPMPFTVGTHPEQLLGESLTL